METLNLAPFSCTFTPNMPELLHKLKVTIAISTFQAGKVIFISPKNEDELIQLPRTFKRPMGMALKDGKMAIATHNEVVVLKNSKSLAQSYPKKPNTYDALFSPRASYFTGGTDIHDLHWGDDRLYAVNTSFSCLCIIDEEYSFTPFWKPHFITELDGTDRCHLNGLAMQGGKPKYISALGRGNILQSWRDNITTGGVIIDIESNEIICSGLAMPHSPRIYDSELFVLLSAEEKLVKVDVQTGKTTDVVRIPGFVRGMVRHGDFLFVATSKLRKNSSTFKHLTIADKADVASVYMIHFPTATIMSQLTYTVSVDEIYDILILADTLRPNIINTYDDMHLRAIHLPHQTYWQENNEAQG